MEAAYSALPNVAQTNGRSESNLSDDDDDVPDGARSASFLSSVDALPEQYRAQEAHLYPGQLEHQPRSETHRPRESWSF